MRLKTPAVDILAFKGCGKLHDEVYKNFVPAIDAALTRHPKVRLFAKFRDFHGWDANALWDDTALQERPARLMIESTNTT